MVDETEFAVEVLEAVMFAPCHRTSAWSVLHRGRAATTGRPLRTREQLLTVAKTHIA